MPRLTTAGLAGLLVAASVFPAWAAGEARQFKATLDGASEVPATGGNGSGQVAAQYDPATRKLSWTGSYSGLTGPATMAHFHGPAKAGENAGVLVPVDAKASPFSGEAVLDEAKAADLEAGRMYFNIHTAANPKGEIRGQVEAAR